MTELMKTVECPHCGEKHNINFNDKYHRGSNLATCLQHTDDCEIATRGCRKRFVIEDILTTGWSLFAINSLEAMGYSI